MRPLVAPEILFEATFAEAQDGARADAVRELHGVALPEPLAAWLGGGGIARPTAASFVHSWLRPTVEPWTAVPERAADNAFAARVERAQRERSALLLLEPLAGLLPLAERDEFFLVASLAPEGTAIAGYEQRHDEPVLDAPLADGIVAFVGLRHLYDSVHWRGPARPERDPRLCAAARALSGRIRPAFPYEELRALTGALDGFCPLEAPPDPRPTRCLWLATLLRDGQRALDDTHELARLRALDTRSPWPATTLRARDLDAAAGLHLLWRAFFDGHDALLERLLPALRSHPARWLRDATRLVEEARRGPRRLGHIDDLAAFARRYRCARPS